MRKPSVIVLATLALGAAVLMVASPADAQDTTDVYIVHGVNDADQTAPGGTPVTVCADGVEFIPELEFGDVAGPFALESGTPVNLVVYGGPNVDCASPGMAMELINDDKTPEGAAVAYAATLQAAVPPGEPVSAFTPYPIDLDCTVADEGELTVAHASADTGDIEVLVDGESEGTESFGGTMTTDLAAGDHSLELTTTGPSIPGPVDITIGAQTNHVVYVIGNVIADGPPTPIVLVQDAVDVDECEEPTTTTTTTTTPAPTSTTVAPVAPVPTPAPTQAPLSVTG